VLGLTCSAEGLSKHLQLYTIHASFLEVFDVLWPLNSALVRRLCLIWETLAPVLVCLCLIFRVEASAVQTDAQCGRYVGRCYYWLWLTLLLCFALCYCSTMPSVVEVEGRQLIKPEKFYFVRSFETRSPVTLSLRGMYQWNAVTYSVGLAPGAFLWKWKN